MIHKIGFIDSIVNIIKEYLFKLITEIDNIIFRIIKVINKGYISLSTGVANKRIIVPSIKDIYP
jgi:hypothetical protein